MPYKDDSKVTYIPQCVLVGTVEMRWHYGSLGESECMVAWLCVCVMHGEGDRQLGAGDLRSGRDELVLRIGLLIHR